MSEEQTYQDPERLDLPSASQLEIVVNCPGMLNLKRKVPPENVSRSDDDETWAKRGTRIHRAFQTDSILDLNSEEVETYNKGKAFLEQILARWIESNGLDRSRVVEGPRELRIWMSKPWAFPQPMFSAQLDRHYVYRSDTRKMLLVADLKSGWNPNLPPSNRSWQLKSQLIAAVMEEYPDIEDGRVTYIKAKDKVERADYCDYSAHDIKYSHDSLAFHCWESTQEDAPRHPGEWCRWCPAKAHCPEALAFALLPSTMVRMSKDGRKRVVHADEVLPEDLLKLHNFKGAIGAILDAVNDRLKTFSEEDLAKIGLMLGKARENSYFTDLKAACHFLTEEKAIFGPEQVWAAMELSLGPLSSILALRNGNTEDESKEWLKAQLKPYMATKTGERPIVNLK